MTSTPEPRRHARLRHGADERLEAAMRSPFPGMDPYLEDPGGWGGVHDALIAVLREGLNRQLGPDYIADGDTRVYIVSPDEQRWIFPDIYYYRDADSGGPASGPRGHRGTGPDTPGRADNGPPALHPDPRPGQSAGGDRHRAALADQQGTDIPVRRGAGGAGGVPAEARRDDGLDGALARDRSGAGGSGHRKCGAPPTTTRCSSAPDARG